MTFTIRNKLSAGFAGVLLLMAAVAVIGCYAVFSLRQSAHEAMRIGARLNAVALEIQVHSLETERRIKSLLAERKPGEDLTANILLEEAEFEIHEIRSLASEASKISPTEGYKAKFDKVISGVDSYEEKLKQALVSGEEAAQAEVEFLQAAEQLRQNAEDGEVAGKEAGQKSILDIERTSKQSVTLVTAISMLALVLGIAFSYKLSRLILDPVEHLKEVAENVSLGNLDLAVKRYSEDEIGDLADSFSRMVTAVKFFRMESEMAHEKGEEHGSI